MKNIICILLFIYVPMTLFCELVSVPGYNYSINPLEGWILQPYEDDSHLNWLSNNGNIALSVTSWSGNEFSDIKSMFDQLTEGLDASGSFVKFNYIGLSSAIGEITFTIGDNVHKGWMLFVDGMEFDYYIHSFTLLDNYDEYNSEIQSVVDSFSYGDNGPLNPGPISSFIDESPNRLIKKYNIDFFGKTLIVPVAEYDFGTSQAVIEREANIMSNYTNDPENFYNAWKRYYKIIFRDNYSRLEPLFIGLYPYFADNKYTDYELVELLMFWIQSYTYKRSLDSDSDLLNPLEASVTKTGDCDARSILLGILLHKFGVDNILLTSEKVKHAIIAVNCPGDGHTYEYDGKKYLTVELTTKALIGEIKESISDPDLWTPVEMEYSNGF